MKPMIGVYARISFDRDGEGAGVQRQQVDNRGLAAQRGWDVLREYTDNSMSAYKDDVVRPEFERLLADLESGEIDGFVAWKVDRITRQLRDLVRLMEIHKKQKFFIATVMDGEIDMSQVLMNALRFADAQQSSQTHSDRIRRKLLQNAIDGKPYGAPVRPYGYSQDRMTLDPVEATVVRKMGELFMNGYSYREIAWRLNETATLTRVGKPWYPDQIKKFLQRDRNAGYREVEGTRYPGQWEPIFSSDQWEAIQSMAKHRKAQTRQRPSNRRYLLTGMLHCGKCGGYLYGMTKSFSSGLVGTYQCRTQTETDRKGAGCGGCMVQSPPLDHFVRELICARLDTPLLSELIAASSVDQRSVRALLSEHEQLTIRAQQMIDDYADGTLDKPAYQRASARVAERLESVDREIQKHRRPKATLDLKPGDSVRAAWDANPDGWRRELIELLIERIEIMPATKRPAYSVDGNRFTLDPERVKIDWKM
ncbi:recombinase family protein [Naasia lichenicola]|uniref:Recombinase family protein n=1 Tax=Naasia lichenicola TaxID=2565933 RepID=A0A4S4FKZ3_9MICO|nr:recombinase family protein [Naasia lichenicola]THG30704.1 recombinase family protein [Naasia lichenicola]THG31941.1 recombinase family protein [Naasia lichenicola]